LEQNNNNIYNKIAYTCFFLACLLSILLIMILFDIILLDNENIEKFISTLIIGLSLIYHYNKTMSIEEFFKKIKNSLKK